MARLVAVEGQLRYVCGLHDGRRMMRPRGHRVSVAGPSVGALQRVPHARHGGASPTLPVRTVWRVCGAPRARVVVRLYGVRVKQRLHFADYVVNAFDRRVASLSQDLYTPQRGARSVLTFCSHPRRVAREQKNRFACVLAVSATQRRERALELHGIRRAAPEPRRLHAAVQPCQPCPPVHRTRCQRPRWPARMRVALKVRAVCTLKRKPY